MPRINAFRINRFCRTIRIPLAVFLLCLFWSGPVNLIAVENQDQQATRMVDNLTSDIVPNDSLQDGPGKLYLPIIFKNFDPALYILVPNVQGLAQIDAEAAIVAANLTVGTITQGTSPTVPAGRVMSQNPGAGMYVAKGTPVNLVISTGPTMVNVPNVVDRARTEAEGLIVAASLLVGTVFNQYNETVSVGSVISQSPTGGTLAAAGTAVNLWVSLGSQGIPPDPSTVAPPINPTVATNVAGSTEFLYTGDAPIQNGVFPGTIEPKRAAVIRGKVLTRDGNPLPGATITILNHPEYGYTHSRADGMFDMAVNGGGYLTISYQKVGYLEAQRQLNVPWQDYVWAPDVALIPLDTQVTQINLNTPVPFQVAQGNTVTDTDGIRQATLLIPQGTSAQMVMPDGSTLPLTNLSIRATEYTVGPNGAKAMPAELPPNSAYTYCVEFSADEALAAGAGEVRFNQPLYFYLDSFIPFPAGEIVPTGYYDRKKGQWIPLPNGRVIKILSITGGLADLDTNGDGQIDDAATLSALNITDAERQQLAGLYPQTPKLLWRVPIPHFSPVDCNWGRGLPDGSAPGGGPPGGGSGGSGGGGGGGGGGSGGGSGGGGPGRCLGSNCDEEDEDESRCDNDCCKEGSVIGCQSQTLGESIALSGTPFRLHYESDRVPGHRADYTLQIPLSDSSPPAPLIRIELDVTVAGQFFQETFSPLPNQTYSFTWDGRNAFEQPLQGDQTATVRIGYVYPAVYQAPMNIEQAFAQYGEPAVEPNTTRQEITLWREWRISVGTWDTRSQGLGGWNLNIHNAYVPLNKVLYLGSGGRRSLAPDGSVSALSIITRAAGTGTGGFSGDGGPATQAQIRYPEGIAVGPDGSLYIGDYGNARVRKVTPDGTITTAAGTGTGGFSGDGGPATLANLNYPRGVALGPDGGLYIADTYNYRIRRVGLDGIITTVAGNGTDGFSGDGGLAIQAQVKLPQGVAIGPDGSLYIADTYNHRIRRVGPDGIITTVAGNGFPAFNGDGGPASQAQLNIPMGVAAGPDGSLYIADYNNYRIRKVGPDGIITTVAGNGTFGFGDGGQATQTGMLPTDVAVGHGSLYIADQGHRRIRRVGPDGIITTLAGSGQTCYTTSACADGGLATAAQFSIYGPGQIAIAPDGTVYTSDSLFSVIRRVASSLPYYTEGDINIPSNDGRLLYHFDSGGRHLRTLEALTGALRYQFDYDAAGRLASVTDRDGNVTTIEHDGDGNPTTIVGPYGQRTTLTVYSNGYLSNITNPAGEATHLVYNPEGLLTDLTDPRGNLHNFTYDALGLGRLTKDEDPAGGFKTLARVEAGQDYTVTLNTALGRTTSYRVENLPEGGRRSINTFPDGLQTEQVKNTDGTMTNRFPDGTVASFTYGPDPRWGMLAPIEQTSTLATPDGLTSTVSKTRTVTLADPNNPLSLTNLTDTILVNGRSYIETYVSGSRTFTVTTPSGRQVSDILDAQGRKVQSQVAGLLPTHYAYDNRGRLSTATTGAGLDTRSISLSYNNNGYLETIFDPLGRTVSLQYDAAGRVTQQTLPDGRMIHLAYDANGNITAFTPPGRPVHAFLYTPVDLVSEYSPPDVIAGPDQTLYTYDLDRKLTRITRPDGQTIDFSYDNAGRPSTLTTPRGPVSYTYNPATGHLATITTPGGYSLSYTYDGSLLRGETWAGDVAGSATRTYDNDFRLATQSVNGGNTVAFTYDADSLLTQAGSLTLTRNAQNGLLTGTTLGNVVDTRTYNSFGERAGYAAAYGGATLFAQQYTRDKLGRITQKTEFLAGVTDTYDYTYDLADRLTGVRKNGANIASYTYDSNGNRLTGPLGTTNYIYDDQDRLTQSSVLSPPSSTVYSYTANGELISKTTDGQTTTYTYDVLGNLMAASLPNGTQIEYLVDGRNRRIGKKVTGALTHGFLYQGKLRPVAELDGSNNVISRFVYAGRANVPAYMVKGGLTYHIITDHLGSPRLVVNVATGEIAQRMDYDEFGNVTSDTNPGFQPFGFAGGLYDHNTGLVRFGARDYDAETGRWTAKDPIRFAGGQANLYGYVFNNPINRQDPIGLQPCEGRNDDEHGEEPFDELPWYEQWWESFREFIGLGFEAYGHTGVAAPLAAASASQSLAKGLSAVHQDRESRRRADEDMCREEGRPRGCHD